MDLSININSFVQYLQCVEWPELTRPKCTSYVAEFQNWGILWPASQEWDLFVYFFGIQKIFTSHIVCHFINTSHTKPVSWD